MLLPSIFLFLLLGMPHPQKLLFRKIILSLVIPSIVFIVDYYCIMPAHVRSRTAATWWMPPVTGDLIGKVGAYLVGLPSIEWSFSVFEKYGMVVAVAAMALLCLMFAIFAGSLLAGNWRRSYPLLVAALCHCSLLVGYSFFKVPIFGERTALPALIPLIGFMGCRLPQSNSPKYKWFPVSRFLSSA